MMFKRKSIFNASFDMFAGNYHSVRPGYPPQAYQDISSQCGFGSESRLLEIGAGSGIATKELARLGCHIVALEPGENLAAIATDNTKEFPKVQVVVGTFEDYASPEKFDAILAFTAFHWINDGDEDKFKKVASLMKSSGTLVLVWNSFFQSDTQVTAEVNAAYRGLLPEVYPEDAAISDVNRSVLDKLHRREQEVVGNTTFYTTFIRKYLSAYRYDEVTYLKLLNTYPKIVGIEDGRRQAFLDRIGAIVKKHGTIMVPVLTTVILCQQQDHFLRHLSSE